ncbi:MAG: hypothetical protein K2X93_17370 [Candidatus Obscuribacterales bacterium]|nr:hypothetical protein [Candidatus Obscuribacterales bacterium]
MSDIPKPTLESYSPSSSASRLVEDAYNTTVQTVKDHPVATTVGVVAVGAGLLYLTRGRSLKTTLQADSALLKGGATLGAEGAATEKLVASSIPITAETRAAIASGKLARTVAGELKPATNALVHGGTAQDRALLNVLRQAQKPNLTAATEALSKSGIPINPANRAAVQAGELGLDASRGLGKIPGTPRDPKLIEQIRQAASGSNVKAAGDAGLDASRGLGKLPGGPRDPKLLEEIRQAASGSPGNGLAGRSGKDVSAATEALSSRSIPINEQTRALASRPDILPLSPYEQKGAIDASGAMLRDGIPITPQMRSAAINPSIFPLSPHERRLAITGADDVLRSAIPINPEARALATDPKILRLPPADQRKAILDGLEKLK